MALYLNRVTLIGNLGQDPQIINGQGYTLYSFSVATSRGYKDNNTGEWVNITDWHRCSLFVANNTPANLVQAVQNLRKGAYVYVEGSLRNRKYTDQATNTERTAIDISVESLNILERQSTSGNFGNNQNFGNQGFGNNNQGFANNQNFQNGYGNNANAGNNFANNQNSFNHSGFNKPTGSFGNNGQSNFANANAQNIFANNNQASSVTWGNNQASNFNNNSSNNDSPYDHFANTNTSFKKDTSEGEANKKEDKAPVDNISNEDIPF